MHQVGVFAFHAENQISPAEVAGGDFDARTVGRTGGTGVVARMILKQGLRRGTAPSVARTDEEEVGLEGLNHDGC